MNNKRVYVDKIKPLSSFYIDYYGEEYTDKINDKFNNLVYNFDDIFTPSLTVFDNSSSMLEGLIYNYKNIKAKNMYNELFNKYRILAIEHIKEDFNIDLSDTYDLFINNYFSLDKMNYILEDNNRLQAFAKMINIELEKVELICMIFFSYKINFLKDLLKIRYFKDLYKKFNKSFDIYGVNVELIFDRMPFVTRYKDIEKNREGNYLYFPYLNYLEENNNVDTMILHELIHLSESEGTRIGLYDKDNNFVNEVRTDIVAMNLKKKLNRTIFEKRDIPYKSLYLKIALPYIPFLTKYEKTLSDVAISGDLDKLTYYFGKDWYEFSKRMDELFNETYKELMLRKDDHKIEVNYDQNIVLPLVNKMDEKAKILIK